MSAFGKMTNQIDDMLKKVDDMAMKYFDSEEASQYHFIELYLKDDKDEQKLEKLTKKKKDDQHSLKRLLSTNNDIEYLKSLVQRNLGEQATQMLFVSDD